MTQGLEAVTTATLALALDAAHLRQQAHAANIANANTEGYVPFRVSFETQLTEARSALEAEGRVSASDLTGVAPVLEQFAPSAGASVALDQEVAAMAHDASRFQALLKVAAKHYALLAAAVSDGKK